MTANDLQADELRSRVYALLGNLLAGPPRAGLLERLSGIEGDASGDVLARAWHCLGAAARQADIKTLDDEYHDLFIGLARGELVPYASWYQTGLLMEQPLADLRDDLQQLGVERRNSVSEPEDHAAALCQVMALLIQNHTDGSQAVADYAAQQAFVARHLAPWIKRFFRDLEAAESADFYRSVARLGHAFIDFEWRYLELDDIPIRRSKHEGNPHERA